MTITQIDNTHKGRFQIKENDVILGELSYRWADVDTMVISHTNVNQSFSGQGVGRALVMEAIKFARDKGVTILPNCPFAKSVFAETEEIEDVWF